jgi:hypothetical protein
MNTDELPEVNLPEPLDRLTFTRIRLRLKNNQKHFDKMTKEIDFVSSLMSLCKTEEERIAVATKITSLTYMRLSYQKTIEDLKQILGGKVPKSVILQQIKEEEQKQGVAGGLCPPNPGEATHTSEKIEDIVDRTCVEEPTDPFS